MSIKRKLVEIYKPAGQPGFLGAGHIARPVIQRQFSESDPFIMLMDDELDKKDNIPVGGPHPHAGFETVSLLLEGEIGDDLHKMKTGDFQMMTAGSGVIHTETIEKPSRMRLFQLWLNLPKKDRWAAPRLQDMQQEHVPNISSNGVDIKLYSGSLAGISSPLKNYTPVIIADITVAENKNAVLQLPANFNTFLYVLKGEVRVGEEGKLLRQDEVGWLDIFGSDELSDLKISAEQSARFV